MKAKSPPSADGQSDDSLRADGAIGTWLGGVVDRLVEEALARIKHSRGDRDDDVHEIRTTIKRLRAVLRLLRHAMSERIFQCENARLKTAAHRLAGVRDATVAEQSLIGFAKSAVGKDERKAFVLAIDGAGALAQNRADAAREQAMPAVARALEESRRNIHRLRFKGDEWEVFGPGLEEVYRATRKRMRRAFAKGGGAVFHLWRVRVKNFYHVLQLLVPVSSRRLGRMVTRLRKLQSRLGADHDFVVLRTTLEAMPEQFGGTEAVELVVAALKRRDRKLRQASKRLGRAIFRKKPRTFLRKFKEHWRPDFFSLHSGEAA